MRDFGCLDSPTTFVSPLVWEITHLADGGIRRELRANRRGPLQWTEKFSLEYNSVMGKNCNGIRALLVLAVVLALGCKAKKPLLVNVAPGFSGVVTITCDSNSDDFQTITIDSAGRNSIGTCPAQQTELVVVRDGKAVPPEGLVTWESTGDGVPVSIQFTIR
jgi:hypothetical protein